MKGQKKRRRSVPGFGDPKRKGGKIDLPSHRSGKKKMRASIPIHASIERGKLKISET